MFRDDARFAELRGIVFQVCFAKFADIQHVPLRQTVLWCGFTFWEDFLYFSDWSKLYVDFGHTWNLNKTCLGHFDSWHEESTSKTGHQRSLKGFSSTLRSQLPNLLMAAPKNRMSKWRNSGLQWQRGDNETVTIVILTGTPLKQKEWHGSPDVWIFFGGSWRCWR